jgi:hypothetical protein
MLVENRAGSLFLERKWKNEILMSAHTNIVIAHKKYFGLCGRSYGFIWSLIKNMYMSLSAHKEFLWALKRDFFSPCIYILCPSILVENRAGEDPCFGKGIGQIRSLWAFTPILWLLIRDIFYCVINEEYLKSWLILQGFFVVNSH